MPKRNVSPAKLHFFQMRVQILFHLRNIKLYISIKKLVLLREENLIYDVNTIEVTKLRWKDSEKLLRRKLQRESGHTYR